MRPWEKDPVPLASDHVLHFLDMETVVSTTSAAPQSAALQVDKSSMCLRLCGIISGMNEMTEILGQLQDGDPHAPAQLLPLVYDELRRIAAAQVAGERPGQTLNATALVHEAYLRLVGDQKFESRKHFFAAAAQAMRRILVENARRKTRLKRGGGRQRVDVEMDSLAAEILDEEILTLHEALGRFAVHDPAKAQLVELRFFAGMSLPEIAEHLGISLSSAERAWRYARAWLYAAMDCIEKSAFP
jgi:RNA polymerase sigma factor (TIGR02999 family)